MYILILLLPLLNSFICGLFSFKIGIKGAKLNTYILIPFTWYISLVIFYEVALMGSPCYLHLNNWININSILIVNWGLLFDTLTAVMLVVVLSISTLVHIYSTEYMSGDPHLPRFLSYLSLFTFFMLILVTANNFFQMFVGWEGVGLCSYLLINFWYGRLQANKAALKAMIINRIGDFGLALGIFAIYYNFKSIDYTVVFALAPEIFNTTFYFFNFPINALTFITIFLFVGAVGKSAQIGLHSWLPDAMEGPTPVSALIHAATMVTAGIFLIARCSIFFELAPFTLFLITILGAMTAFIAASIGLVQNDLKRVIAYSTCSQLGYMAFACGLSNYSVSIFHLSNHAFFKALLFLSAGSVIHSMSDEQDMRKMGGLIKLLPFSYSMFFIGSIALAGFPFLSGFYSKDLILELAYSSFTIHGHFAYYLGTISAGFTAFYSTRLLNLTFTLKPEGNKQHYIHIHDAPIKMAIPLFLLSIGSIFIGFLSKDMMVGLGSHFWGNSFFIYPQNFNLVEAEFLQTNIKLLPSFFSFFGFFFASLIFYRTSKNKSIWNNSFIRFLNTFLNRKWFFDKIYNDFIAQNILVFAYSNIYKHLDRGIIELIGPYGISNYLYYKSKKFFNLKITFMSHYIQTIFIYISTFLIILTYILTNQQSLFISELQFFINYLNYNLYEFLIIFISILVYLFILF